MKALPLLTLALCVGFLVFQRASLSSITKSNTVLQTRIDQAESSPPPPPRESGAGPSAATKTSGRGGVAGNSSSLAEAESVQDLDLEEFVEAMQKAQAGRSPDFKAMIRLRSLLLEATPEEISDLIARTEALEVPEELKQGIIGQFVEVLSEHDPRAALELALNSPHLSLDKQRWNFSSSFSKWVRKEPEAAIAWFDRELAKGTFESRSLSGESDTRREFEGAVIGALAQRNTARARERLLALPEEERLRILSQSHRFGLHGSDGDPAVYGELVRESLPEEQRAKVFGSAAQNIVHQKGYDGVVEFADTINASRSERDDIVRRAALRQFERMNWEQRAPSAEDVAELRSFLQAEAPGSLNRITGEALGRSAGSKEKFDAAVRLLRETHAASPDDQLLAGFLESPGVQRAHREEARQLAEEIADPAQREALLEKLE